MSVRGWRCGRSLHGLSLSRQVGLVAAIGGVAWILVVWLGFGGNASARETSTSVWWCMPGMNSGTATGGFAALDLARTMPSWLLMSLAMMLPGELPATQYVATNTFRGGRSSAVVVFVLAYVFVWMICGIPATLLRATPHALSADTVFAIALLAAGVYELTAVKRLALNRCHRGAPLPPSGIKRIAAVARFSWISSSGCVASCWPAMLAASMTPVMQPLAMAGFTFSMTYGRLTRRPRTARRRVATSYFVAAIAFAVTGM